MENVYILHHVYEYDELEEVRVIGVYKTENKAKAALNILRQKNDFNEYPNGFYINEYQLNKSRWTEGFNIDDEMPDPEMTQEQKVLVSKLTQENLNVIDSELLANADDNWRKVAMIVGITMEKLENRVIGIPDLFSIRKVKTFAFQANRFITNVTFNK